MTSLARLLRAVEVPTENASMATVDAGAAASLTDELAAIRRPGAVQIAQAAVDAARTALTLAENTRRALIQRRFHNRQPLVGQDEMAAADAAFEAAKIAFFNQED